MAKKSPYQIVKSRYVSEKSTVLESLKDADSNPSLRRCEACKYVFVVDEQANKNEIANAVEEIYAGDNIKVSKVNVINAKPKRKGRARRKEGFRGGFKKAIVTLKVGDEIKE